MENQVMQPDQLLVSAPPSAGQPAGEPTPRERVWLFPKTAAAVLSANFMLGEFHCKCRGGRCHFTLVHPVLVASLQTLREMVARPLLLTSGFRCVGYNRLVGGRARSYHTRGMAADVICADLEQLEELARAAERIPAFGGIGRYPREGFVHLDVRARAETGSATTWSG